MAGFGIDAFSSFSDDTSKDIYRKLKNAENKGLTEIKFKAPWGFHNPEDKIGQIFHWKKYKNEDKDEDDRTLKNVWELVAFEPKGEEDDKMITLKVTNKNYYKQKQTIITDREMQTIVDKKGFGAMKVGRFCIKDDGDYGRILKIFVEEMLDSELTYQDNLRNPHDKEIKKDEIFVEFEYESRERIEIKDIKFDGNRKETIDEFLKTWMIIDTDNIVEFEKRIFKMKETQELDQFKDVLMIGGGFEENPNNPNSDNALIGLGSKEHLEVIHDQTAKRREDAMVLKASFNRMIQLKKEEVEALLEKEKEALAMMLQQLNHTIAVFKKQMEKIYRLITTLEIYLGVHENVIQIAEGEPANVDDPICLRQMQLYMDEEFGDPENGGLDFENIEAFDKWLVDSGGYKTVIPESKCVVVLRPRRKNKDRWWMDNFKLKAEMENLDRAAYILIRNGDNLYRIWSEHIEVMDRLFPKKKELQSMMDEMFKLQKELKEEQSEYYQNKITDKMDDVDKTIFYYKRNFLLLQGIVMRTEIFTPTPQGLNLLDVNTHGEHVKFIYDDEDNKLPSGRIPYPEWLSNINKSVVKGSRIFVAIRGDSNHHHSNRFSIYWRHDSSAPPLPMDGVYELKMIKDKVKTDIEEWIPLKDYKADERRYEEAKDKHKTVKKFESGGTSTTYNTPAKDHQKYYNTGRTKKIDNVTHVKVKLYDYENLCWKFITTVEEKLRISYNPKDKVNPGWGADTWQQHERKTNLTFIIKPEVDNFILHYDALVLDDLDFYINDRVNRVHYLSMMPVLKGIRFQLKQEAKIEQEFVKSLSSRLAAECDLLDKVEEIEPLVWKAVRWFKEEVVKVWKRPITKNDAKAWVMITQETKRLIRDTFKLKIDTGVYNKNKVLIWKKSHYSYIGTGFHKAEFVTAIINHYTMSYRDKENNPKAKINREIGEASIESYKKLANDKKGKILVIDDSTGKEVPILHATVGK